MALIVRPLCFSVFNNDQAKDVGSVLTGPASYSRRPKFPGVWLLQQLSLVIHMELIFAYRGLSWVPPVYLPRYILMGDLKGVSQGLRLKSYPDWHRGSHKDPKSHCLYIVHYWCLFLLGIVVAKHSRMGLGYTNTPFPFWHISMQYCSLASQQ